MKRLSIVGSWLVLFACSTSPQEPVTPLAPAAPLGVAVGPQRPPTNVVVAVSDAPPHVFQPRSRPPHYPARVEPVDLARLPRLRTSQCFAQPEERAVTGGGFGKGAGGMAIGGVVSGSARTPISAPSKPAAAPGAPTAVARPKASDVGRDDARKAEAAPAPQAPAAAAGPAPAATAGAPLPPSPPRAEAEKKAAAEEGARSPVIAEREAPAQYEDYGASIYLSNDDSMSLSSAQRVIFAIDRFLPIPEEHIRPHELLNYFSFDTAPLAHTDDFSVHAEIDPKPGKPGEYTLGLSVRGRGFTKEERRNAALTFVIDRSGSMQDEGRMEYLKRGLRRMTSELKKGDLVNLVLFDDRVCTPIENFVVGRDSMQTLGSTIDRLAPRGATDVYSGLRAGYALADKAYQAAYSNRVMLITDALANTGVTDPEMMAMVSSHYDRRRIRLSGIGVGSDFNDGLLDRLTERGKGAYVFLGSPREVDAVFGDRFVSLIETIANDVHFKLQLPPSLRMNVFYGEESSTVKEDVQAIHYFAGTSQLFLSDLVSRTPALRTQDSVMLTIEYEHPDTGQKQFEDFAFDLGTIAQPARTVKKGRLVMSFIDGIADMARSAPQRTEYRAGGWIDGSASEQCARGRVSLAEQARAFERDGEVERVLELWDKYCSRYEATRAPVRRKPPQGSDVWPSAQR